MYRVVAGALLLLLLPVYSAPLWAQSTTPTEQPQREFFSGIITALADDKVTVLKAVRGKTPETLTFLISKDTRVEGKLRMKARVTVRYADDEDGHRAVHIIVRTSQKK